ncbi:MAG: hypothetical protein M5U08_25185 [Burkholderiales bacterium]|nr:hypothetical protein [Burkholderiales bacterium]
MRELVLGRCAGARLAVLEERVHLGVGDLDLAVDLALAQPRDQHLGADVVAELLPRQAFALERAPELGRREAVLLRDALQRAIEIDLADAHSGLAGELHLHEIGDHALEHLALEHLLRRQRRALAAQLRGDALGAPLELAHGHHLLVDHRGDPVGEHDARPLRRLGEHRSRRSEHGGGHEGYGGERRRADGRHSRNGANPARVPSTIRPAPVLARRTRV